MKPLRRMVTAVGLIAGAAIVWVYAGDLSDKLQLVASVQTFNQRDQRQAEADRTSEDRPRSGSEIVDAYKKWTRVNPEPAVLPSRIAMMCFTPTPEQVKMEESSPHLDKFITVYVNDIGRHAMMEELSPRFPRGSVIVKEKLAAKDSSSPELLTVMIKREAGYNARNGDWEYMVLDGPGKSVQARGKLEHCQACHRTVKHTDYVSRRYLPNEVWQKLK